MILWRAGLTCEFCLAKFSNNVCNRLATYSYAMKSVMLYRSRSKILAGFSLRRRICKSRTSPSRVSIRVRSSAISLPRRKANFRCPRRAISGQLFSLIVDSPHWYSRGKHSTTRRSCTPYTYTDTLPRPCTTLRCAAHTQAWARGSLVMPTQYYPDQRH